MAKQPYIPLYTGDYLKDTRMLPLSVRGAWIDLMIFMWESKERGVLAYTMPEYAMMMSCSLEDANFAIGLLQEKGICDFEISSNGMVKLICRRMVRDAQLSKTRSEVGSLGGRPKKESKSKSKSKTKHETKTKANSDIDNDNEVDSENNKKEPVKISRKVPRGTDEALWDVENWTEDVIQSNDEVFIQMVKHLNLNGQLEDLARSHLGLCSRYEWHLKMDSQQAFRYSLLNHIKERLKSVTPTKKEISLEELKARKNGNV